VKPETGSGPDTGNLQGDLCRVSPRLPGVFGLIHD
jgi:hypothetical protein